MRAFKSFVGAASALALVVPAAGCGTLNTETQFHETGGIPGRVLDSGLAAESNQMQLYRFAMIFAMLSEAASLKKEQNVNDVVSLNLWMHKADKDIFKAYLAVYPRHACNAAAGLRKFRDPCWEEAPIYDGPIEDDLLHLARLTLPQKETANFESALKRRDALGMLSAVLKASPELVHQIEFSSGVVRASDMTLALAAATQTDQKLEACEAPAYAGQANGKQAKEKEPEKLQMARVPLLKPLPLETPDPSANTCVFVGVGSAHDFLKRRSGKYPYKGEEGYARRLVNLAPWGYDVMYHGVLDACDRLKSYIGSEKDDTKVVTVQRDAFCQFYYSNMRLMDDREACYPDLFAEYAEFPVAERAGEIQ